MNPEWACFFTAGAVVSYCLVRAADDLWLAPRRRRAENDRVIASIQEMHERRRAEEIRERSG